MIEQLLKPIRLIFRSLFKRKGHGIHSPFAYHLIRNVIGEPNLYYIYDELAKLPIASKDLRARDVELLYRLSLYHKPQVIVAAAPSCQAEVIALYRGGDGKGEQMICFSSFSSNNSPPSNVLVKTNAPEEIEDYLRSNPKIDLLYIDTEADHQKATAVYQACRPYLHSSSVVVVREIWRSAGMRSWWRHLKRDEARVTFDLYHFGLLYLEPTLTKGNYTVGY